MPEIERIQPFGPGTQEYDIRDNTKLPIAGGRITGNLEVAGSLTLGTPLQASALPTVPINKGGTGKTTATEALNALGAAASLNLSSYTTWATLYPVFSTIPASKTVVFCCDGSNSGASSLLTGGAATASLKGTVTSLGGGTYDFLAFTASGSGSGELATWRITGFTAASATPTVAALQRYYGGTDAAAARTRLGAAASSHTHSQYFDNATSRTKNTVLAAPGSANGAASFRALVSDDLPTVPISKGGTGKTTAAEALTALGAAAAGHTHGAGDITSGTFTTDRLPTIPINKGGTGKTTAAEALTALGAAAASHDHTSLLSPFSSSNRTATADQNPGDRRLQFFHATSSMTTNKPPDGDGHILHFSWDNASPSWASQLFLRSNSPTHMMIRGRNSTTWETWKRVYTENDVVPIANGGTGKTTAAEALTALGGISRKLLWTNSAPTSAMTGTTIAISNMSSYQEFEVYFMLSTSTQYMESRNYLYNQQGRVVMHNGTSPYTRDVKPVSTGLTITTGTSSSYVIPYKVYGIKGVT